MGSFSSGNRYLFLKRGNHFYAGGAVLGVVIDDLECAKLKSNQQLKIPLTPASHTIQFKNYTPFSAAPSFTSSPYTISAGSGDVHGEVTPRFPNDWNIELTGAGGDPDAFCRQAEEFAVALFRSKEARDLLHHENNRRNDVSFFFDKNGLVVYFEAKNTKGFEEWSTGHQRFKTPYSDMDICPPANVDDAFYRKVTDRAKLAVLHDPKSSWKKNQYGSLYL